MYVICVFRTYANNLYVICLCTVFGTMPTVSTYCVQDCATVYVLCSGSMSTMSVDCSGPMPTVSMYCAQDLCQQCLCTVFRTLPTMCTVFRTKPTMSVYCVQDLCHRLCTASRPFANNVCALCSGPMPTMSGHCVQVLCQQCLCIVFRTYANNVYALCPDPLPTMSMHCVQDLCQQCLCTVFRFYANNVCALCSGPMPTMSMHCVQDLCQQCLCTVFRTYANNVCALCPGPLPTMSMHCVQDLCQQCLCTVSRPFANNVYALCSGPMPAAHAEQGLGEARATARSLSHRQRVRVGSPQSFQSLLHLLLVSHRSFLASLSSSVPLCPSLSPSLLSSLSLSVSSVLIYHPAYRLFLLSWSVGALFCLPCHRLLLFFVPPVYRPSFCPYCHRLFPLSWSIAVRSVPSVAVCSHCPGLSPSVLSSVPPSVPSVLDYRRPFCPQCRHLFPLPWSIAVRSVPSVTVGSLCPGLSPSVLSLLSPSVTSVLVYRRLFCPHCRRLFPLSWSIAVRSVPCVTVCSICPGLSPSVLSPVSPCYCSFCSGQPPAGLCRQYTCPSASRLLKITLYPYALYYSLSTFLPSSLQENMYHSVLLSKAMTRQSVALPTCVQLQSLRKLPWP